MPKVADRSAVLTEVERFHGHFLFLNEELNLIVGLLSLEGEGRMRISALCDEARSDLREKAGDLERFREKYCADSTEIDGDAVELAETCVPHIATEIAALDLLAEALAIAENVTDDDLGFVDGVVRTARYVYNSHVAFVHSALTFQGQDLIAFAESYDRDPNAAASGQAFNALRTAEFPQFVERLMDGSSA